MSLKSAPYWLAVCDRCGRACTSRPSLSPPGADLVPINWRWHVEGGNHLCPSCTPLDRDEDRP